MSRKLSETITFRIPKTIKGHVNRQKLIHGEKINLNTYLRNAIDKIIATCRTQDWQQIYEYGRGSNMKLYVSPISQQASDQVMMSLNVTYGQKMDIKRCLKSYPYLSNRYHNLSDLMRQLCILYTDYKRPRKPKPIHENIMADPINYQNTHTSSYLIDIDKKHQLVTVPSQQWQFTGIDTDTKLQSVLNMIQERIMHQIANLQYGQYPAVAKLDYPIETTHEYQHLNIKLKPIWMTNDKLTEIPVNIQMSLWEQAKAANLNLTDILTEALDRKLNRG